jgi:hypothetical protein
MAVVQNNPIVEGLSGQFGSLVFRQVRGKTLMAPMPKVNKKKKQSEAQRATRSKFRLATQFARKAMNNPEQKQYYVVKAKKLKLPNAYTAAITDYMRRGEVVINNAHTLKGKVGDQLFIQASKKGFKMEQVEISFYKNNGTLMHRDVAVNVGSGLWRYTLKEDMDLKESYLQASAFDNARQGVECRAMLPLVTSNV